MIDTAPKAFWEELEASRIQMENRLFSLDEMIGRLHGPYWDKTSKNGGQEPENPAFEWIATMKAQFIAGDPTCTVKPMRVDKPETRLKALAIRHTLNRLARDGDDKEFWRTQFTDWCFSFSSFVVQRTPAPWADRGPVDVPVMRPRLARISPKRLRYDARSTEWKETRWRGYELMASKKAVLQRAKKERGWRTKEIEAIQPDTGDLEKMFPTGGNRVQRDDFKMFIVWFPEEQSDNRPGFWGTVHFYAETQRTGDTGPLVEIRDPQPYYGPRQGPIYMSGQETVPDSPHPLSVMVAIENLAKSLRLQSQVLDHAMQNYKRIYIDGNGDKQVSQKIKSTKHGNVVHIGGWEKNKGGEFTIAGVDSETLAAYQFLLDRLDRRSGLSSTGRGEAQAGKTATAETIAASGGEARAEGLRDEFRRHVRCGWRARGEIICMDEDFYIPLDPAAAQEMIQAGATQIPEYVQGGYEGNESFEDYELDIEPLSMRYQSQEERELSAQWELELWTTLAGVIPTSPFLAWPSILADIGDKRNQPELPERLNVPMAEQIAGVMLMTSLQGSFQDTPPQKQPMTRPKNAQAIDITGSKVAAKPVTPQIGMGAQQKPAGTGMAGNRAGAQAGGMAKRGAKPQKAGMK